MSSSNHQFRPGDFVVETLVTDTSVLEVIAVTAKTVTLRDVQRIPDAQHSPWPMYVEFPVESDPNGEVWVRRIRKDGTLRIADWSRPFRKATPKEFPTGLHYYESVDYSY